MESATHIKKQFAKGKGVELTLDLRGLPCAVDVTRVWLIPSTAYEGNKAEVLITCEHGGITTLIPSASITEWSFVAKGFSLPVSLILSRMIQSFSQLSARTEQPASKTPLLTNA